MVMHPEHHGGDQVIGRQISESNLIQMMLEHLGGLPELLGHHLQGHNQHCWQIHKSQHAVAPAGTILWKGDAKVQEQRWLQRRRHDAAPVDDLIGQIKLPGVVKCVKNK